MVGRGNDTLPTGGSWKKGTKSYLIQVQDKTESAVIDAEDGGGHVPFVGIEAERQSADGKDKRVP